MFGYGMEGTKTAKMEAGDRVVVEGFPHLAYAGTVTKKWKNAVVVVTLDPLKVEDQNLNLVEYKSTENHKRGDYKFNPDGHGRGNKFWGMRVREFRDGENVRDIEFATAKKIWDSMFTEAQHENERRNASESRAERLDAEWKESQRVNAANVEAMETIETNLGPVHILNVINRFEKRRVVFLTIEEMADDIYRGNDRFIAAVGMLNRDQYQNKIANFQSQNNWKAETREKLIAEIVHNYWAWT